MLPPAADRPKLRLTLDQLAEAVEDLLLGGLTTASEATRQTLHVAMQEAARFRLLRLGSSLRAAAEELGRFNRQDPSFSRRRLSFFLNRSWLLGRGIAHALQKGDASEFDRLTWTPSTQALPMVETVSLGAVKKVAAGSFVAFEFRLRATADADPIRAGQRLTWSTLFPVKPGVEIPPEGFLHLPQKQKFLPAIFLDKETLTIRDATVAIDDSGGGRIGLTEQSTVIAGPPFADWGRFLDWSPGPALERLGRQRPGPLDLETELQEEIVLRDYEIGPPEDGDEPGQTLYPLKAGRLALQAVVGPAAEGKALRKNLEDLRKPRKARPPLFGLMHYERCRLVLQPLTTFGKDGPEYLTIAKEVVNKAALLKAMSFT
ncbi:hypothetical protein BH23PLA1_BH23PLA1_25100 [soil metagenome]